ncbi:MAG: hypothetical protein ACJ77T_14020 [Gemmatimonadaceae bacterium]
MVKRIVWVFPAVAILLACAPGTSGTPSTPSGDKVVFTGDLKADWAQIVALEDSAKALVDSTGCTSAAECRTAPVGSRACGGPRYYLVYCSRTTDSAALYRKLEAVANAERDYNIHYKLASTCEFRMPPTVGLTGSSCVAK